MGGSGGGFFSGDSSMSPSELAQKIKREQEQAKSREYESSVNQMIVDSLKSANDRDTELINTHLDTMLDALNKDIEGSVQTIFGGSVSKHTYVDGLSDVDVMIIINNSELLDKSPQEVNDYFANRLKERLPKTEITAGSLAVTVKYSDGTEIQVLPSIKTDTGVKIAKEQGNEWSQVIKPGKFAEKLIATNQHCNGKLVPVIKLAKSILSGLPEKRQMTGYHIESLAVSIFKNYNGDKTSKEMLKHFLTKAVDKVKTPIKDRTGQTVNTDSYLGAKDSTERKAISDSLATIVRKIDNADRSCDLNSWKDLLS